MKLISNCIEDLRKKVAAASTNEMTVTVSKFVFKKYSMVQKVCRSLEICSLNRKALTPSGWNLTLDAN